MIYNFILVCYFEQLKFVCFKAVPTTPRARGPGFRDWTREFVAKRSAKKDLRERLFVSLVKRMAQVRALAREAS